MLNTLLSLLILFSVKESKIAVSCALGNGPGEVGVVHEDIAYGPQDFEVDWEENIYVLDSYNDRRIMKFDSTGKLLFTITEPESIVPIGLAIDTKNNLIVSGSTYRKGVLARYSHEGNLLEVTQASGAGKRPLMSDLKGQIYARSTDSIVAFDEKFNFVASQRKKTDDNRGYAQWTDWIKYDIGKDTNTGVKIFEIRDIITKQVMVLKLPPKHISYGYLEGADKDGNVYTAGLDYSKPIQRIFFRINPIMKTIDTLRVEQDCLGDLGHNQFVSPNGEIYWASIDYEGNELKWYRIFRYSKNLFARME